MDWLSLTSEVLSRERQDKARLLLQEGDAEDSEVVGGPFPPLEAAALCCVLEMASLQLYIVDMSACPSSSRSNAFAREKVREAVDETREELAKWGTFRSLHVRVRKEAEAQKAAELLAESFLQNQSIIEDLKSKLKGQEAAKIEDANEQLETIASLKDAIHEKVTKSDVKLRYVDRREAAARGQSAMRCRAAELELEKKLEEVNKKFDAEIRVHDEMCTFLAHEEKVLLDELQRWKETHEREMKRRGEKIEMLEIRRKEQQILRESLQEKYQERKREMEAYLDFKEKLRREIERERFRNEMATKIQAWWRGTMVRRGLGTFRKKKKSGKEKKKRT